MSQQLDMELAAARHYLEVTIRQFREEIDRLNGRVGYLEYVNREQREENEDLRAEIEHWKTLVSGADLVQFPFRGKAAVDE